MAELMPIKVTDFMQLGNVTKEDNINSENVTMESDRYICVRERDSRSGNIVIIDINDPTHPKTQPGAVDSAIMNPDKPVIGVRAGKIMQVFNIELKSKIKAHTMTDDILFWKWISSNTIAVVTHDSCYHMDVEGDNPPVAIFDRSESMDVLEITDYKIDSDHKWMVLLGTHSYLEKTDGMMQLYSTDKQTSQQVNGHAAAFTTLQLEGNSSFTKLFLFTVFRSQEAKLYVVEIDKDPNLNQYGKKIIDLSMPPGDEKNYPVDIQVNQKLVFSYIVTKLGFMFLHDIETGTCLFSGDISNYPIISTTPQRKSNGIYCVNKKGHVLSVDVDDNIVEYIIDNLNDENLGMKVARRGYFLGGEALFVKKFNDLILCGDFTEAAKVAATEPKGILRTEETIKKLKDFTGPECHLSPLMVYFKTLLEFGKLNHFESIELCKQVLCRERKDMIEKWLKEYKLECSENLGDLLKEADITLALSVYVRANVTKKVIQCYAETGQFQKMLLYVKQILSIHSFDYLTVLKDIVMNDPNKGLSFAEVMLQDKNTVTDLNGIVDVFMEFNCVQQCTSLLLEALNSDKPEEASLQTRILEINLIAYPMVADAILEQQMFSHYDKAYIAGLCDKAGLRVKAEKMYGELYGNETNSGQRIQPSRKGNNMSHPAAYSVCGECHLKQVEKDAVVWCSDCQRGMCNSCKTHHELSRSTDHHHMESITQHETEAPLASDLCLFCDEHREEMTAFCINHDEPCCRKCIWTIHNDCTDVPLLEEMVNNSQGLRSTEELEKVLKATRENIQIICKRKQENLATITEARMKIEKQILTVRRQISDHLDKLQEKAIKELQKTEKETNEEMFKLIRSLKEKEKDIEEYQSRLSDLKKNVSSLRTFLYTKKIETCITENDKYINSMSIQGLLDLQVIVFRMDTVIENFDSNVSAIGQIEVQTKICDLPEQWESTTDTSAEKLANNFTRFKDTQDFY